MVAVCQRPWLARSDSLRLPVWLRLGRDRAFLLWTTKVRIPKDLRQLIRAQGSLWYSELRLQKLSERVLIASGKEVCHV